MKSIFNEKTPAEIAKMLADEFYELQTGTVLEKSYILAINSARLAVSKVQSAVDFDWMEVQNLESEHRRWDAVDTELIKSLNEY